MSSEMPLEVIANTLSVDNALKTGLRQIKMIVPNVGDNLLDQSFD